MPGLFVYFLSSGRFSPFVVCLLVDDRVVSAQLCELAPYYTIHFRLAHMLTADLRSLAASVVDDAWSHFYDVLHAVGARWCPRRQW